MVDKQLLDYVRRMHNQGYPYPSLRLQLQQSGYDPAEIEQALQVAMRPSPSKLIIGICLALALLLAIGAAVWMFSNDTPSQPVSLNLAIAETTLTQGKPLSFTVSQKQAQHQTTLTYTAEIIESQTASTIITDRKPSTTTQVDFFFDTTSLNQGSYIVRVKATGGPGVIITTKTITIEKDTSVKNPVVQTNPSVITPETCNDFNVCTTDTSVNGECTFTLITPCCGNARCEQNEQSTCAADCPVTRTTPTFAPTTQSLDEIVALSTTDPDAAASKCQTQEIPDYKDSCFSQIAQVAKSQQFCTRIDNARIKDLCYSELAKSTTDSATCNAIENDDRRDSCYLTFVLDLGQYDVCERIINENLRQSCDALKTLET